MTVRQWSDHVYAAYTGVTDRPFSGVFVGTATTRPAAEFLAWQRMYGDQNTHATPECESMEASR